MSFNEIVAWKIDPYAHLIYLPPDYFAFARLCVLYGMYHAQTLSRQNWTGLFKNAHMPYTPPCTTESHRECSAHSRECVTSLTGLREMTLIDLVSGENLFHTVSNCAQHCIGN
jgi:hypothetical protein